VNLPIGRDSVTASTIPLTNSELGTNQGILAAVMGYGDGNYQWSAADWQRFPSSMPKLSIVVNASHSGDILDIENGDATPADAPGWCDRFDRVGRRAPTLYCSRSAWPDVQAAIGNRKADFWISTLDGTTFVRGAVAVQYKDFGGYDESTILDPTWIGVKPTSMTAQDYQLIVKGWYVFPPLKRNPLQSEVDFWVNKLLGGENPEQVLDEFTSSPEFVQAMQALYSQGGGITTDQAIKAVAAKLSL